MKALKVLAAAAAAGALLAAGAVVAVRRMFPPEKVRSIVLAQVRERLGREARVGEVRIGAWSGISIAGFAVSERPDFKSGTFLESDGFTLKFQLLPLLRKQVVIEKVELAAPRVRIVQNADGKSFNFSDLIAPGTAPAGAKRPQKKEEEDPARSFSLTISELSLSKGKVEFEDKSPRKLQLLLDPIDLSVAGTQVTKPVSVRLSLRAKGSFQGKPIAGDLDLESVIDAFGQKLDVESLQWKMSELTLDLKGRVESFLSPKLDLSVTLHSFRMDQLARWAALPKDVRISGSPKIGLDLKGGLADLDCKLEADLTQMSFSYADLFQKDEGLQASVRLSGNVVRQNSLDLESLQIALGPIHAALKGSIRNLAQMDPALNLDVEVRPFDLAELGKLTGKVRAYQPGGTFSMQAKAGGTLGTAKVRGSITLDQVRANVAPVELTALSGKLEFSEDSLDVPKLTGSLGAPGKAAAGFEIRASVKGFKQPDVSLQGDVSVLDLGLFTSGKKEAGSKPSGPGGEGEKAKAPQGPEVKARGRIRVGKVVYTKFEGQKAEASWNLTGITPALDKLSGKADFQMADGKVHKIPLLAAIAPILKIDPSGLVYTRMGGHVDFAQGTARSDDFELRSQAADLFAKGTLHLPSNKPDIVLTAKLPKGSIGGSVGEFANDAEGRPTFSFRMKGDWKPALDTGALQKRATEKAAQEIKRKGAEVLQNEGRKILEGIFKR